MKTQVKDLMAKAGSEAVVMVNADGCWAPADPVKLNYDRDTNTLYVVIDLKTFLRPEGHGAPLRGEDAGALADAQVGWRLPFIVEAAKGVVDPGKLPPAEMGLSKPEEY